MGDEIVKCELRRITDEESTIDVNQSSSDVPAASNETPFSGIFKLNVPCFEDLFEWFSFAELLLLRLTCKRMKQVVEYYIKLNYPMALHLEVEEFRLTELRQYGPNLFEWTKHLQIWSHELATPEIENLKNILSRLESIKLEYVEMHCEFYDNLLKYCDKLKHLSMKTSMIGTGNEWLHRHYPTLEHIELDFGGDQTSNWVDVQKFFELNPAVRTLSVDSCSLMANSRRILESGIQLDRLIITVDLMNPITLLDSQAINELHDRGFYKRLHVYCGSGEEDNEHLSSLRALDKLYFYTALEWNRFDNLRTMDGVTELGLFDSCDVSDEEMNLIAGKMINLKRIYVKQGKIGDIRPFLRLSNGVREITFKKFNSGHHERDLITLNNDRKQLPRARKVTIYIPEDDFLRLKWTWKTNFSLIEIRRSDSCEDEYFQDSYY